MYYLYTNGQFRWKLDSYEEVAMHAIRYISEKENEKLVIEIKKEK